MSCLSHNKRDKKCKVTLITHSQESGLYRETTQRHDIRHMLFKQAHNNHKKSKWMTQK